ncbi:MAG: hypothetical protein L0H53_00805 [Candidatus Nitrosocosmicus sp.]|nr:hypothetical protein [Candidatus Nitrosocosmicus sp.]MDN5865957.1 hypothetical protein [Candidatus Nitrosocosmicus sp.]
MPAPKDPEKYKLWKERVTQANRIKNQNPETSKKRSLALSERNKIKWKDLEYRAYMTQKLSEKQKRKLEDPEYRKYICEVLNRNAQAQKTNESIIKKKSESMKKKWQDPEYRSKFDFEELRRKHSLRLSTPEQKAINSEKMRQRMRQRWKTNQEFRNKVISKNKGKRRSYEVKTCINCGIEFIKNKCDIRKALLDYPDRKTWFCSRKCVQSYSVGVNHPQFGKPSPTRGVPKPYLRGKNNPMFRTDTKKNITQSWGFRPDLGHICRSTWEANYCRILKYLGVEYEYEPITFDLPYGSSYTPDIKIGTCFIEIKGKIPIRYLVKLSLFKKYYPDIKLLIIQKNHYLSLRNHFAPLIQTWEHKNNLYPRVDKNGFTAIQRAKKRRKVMKKIYEARYKTKHGDHIKEYGRKYREKNRISLMNKNNEYRQENKDKLLRLSKKYRQENAEIIKVRKKKYAEKNRDRIKKYMKNYRIKNKEHLKQINKEWLEKNREEYLSKKKEYHSKNKAIINLKRKQRYQRKRLESMTKANTTITDFL